MISIQLIGVLIALAASHLTYLYYKRANFTKLECILWLVIWLAFLFVTIFPNSVKPIVGYLGLQRPMDLIMIVAFIILFALTFHNYVVNRYQRSRLESLVRSLSLKELDPLTRQHEK